MGWFAAAVPLIASGVSAASSYVAGKQNAQHLKLQAIASNQQAQVDEESTRRRARQILGDQAGALAENGLGYEGSSGLLTAQSVRNAELDALNTRYLGRTRAVGLIGEADAESRSARMLAGQQLLAGFANGYTSGARLPNLRRTPQSRRLSYLGSEGSPVAADAMRGSY